ncbi:hypothetical protein CC78DRAFT_23925 [Lojkania enalia]|uniref:Uncharacterized protein n=1 Tax=Lojkania enalia TaxID=147567 RepID=A0A9P4MZR5_9PLEO|nr:hypothetical protein CC78DRAFT_23925 [Didymosphaeria enalia]
MESPSRPSNSETQSQAQQQRTQSIATGPSPRTPSIPINNPSALGPQIMTGQPTGPNPVSPLLLPRILFVVESGSGHYLA